MPEYAAGVAVCQFCNQPLKLLPNAISARCMVCGERGRTRTWCTTGAAAGAAGHFVCEECRGSELMTLVEGLLSQPTSTDPVETFLLLRRAHDFPMHGPEHHALVTAAFLLAYHRLYGEPSWPDILDAVQTAATQLPGGTCGFWGACSAGLGLGIAFCTILGSSPTDGGPRSAGHRVVAEMLRRFAGYPGPRCCRRECLVALQAACEMSGELLPHPVATLVEVVCDQAEANDECLGPQCTFMPAEGSAEA